MAQIGRPNIKRSKATYGQLDKVLRSLGFSCHLSAEPPPTRVYLHEETGASIMLPAFPKEDRVFAYHIVMVRGTLDNFGIADPDVLDAKLQKAG